MSSPSRNSLTAALALTLWASGARAQGTEPPKPPAPPSPSPTSAESVGAINTPVQEVERLRSEQRGTTPSVVALSGAETVSGASLAPRSFALFGISVQQQLDSNPSTVATSVGTVMLTSVLGNVALQRSNAHAAFQLTYAVGGLISNRNTTAGGDGLSSMIHDLGLTQIVRGRRGRFVLANQFRFAPESSFGTIQGRTPGFVKGLPHQPGATELQGFLTPNESILSARGGRTSNVFVVEGDYMVSPESLLTAAVGYGVLRFRADGLLDHNSGTFLTGYNRRVGRDHTVAGIYRFNALRFNDVDSRMNTHTLQFSYGRQITGRLGFRSASGPQLERLRLTPQLTEHRWFWSLENSLDYRGDRNGFHLSFLRGLTGGAGLLAGAETNQIDATVTRNFTRFWNASVGFGYAQNVDAAAVTTTRAAVPMDPSYNTWFGRAEMRRSVRGADYFITYVGQRQTSPARLCGAQTCFDRLVRHQVMLGMYWYRGPVAMK